LVELERHADHRQPGDHRADLADLVAAAEVPRPGLVAEPAEIDDAADALLAR